MKINKADGLILAKLLHGHVPFGLIGTPDDRTRRLIDLADRIDRFLLLDEADTDHVDVDYQIKVSPPEALADEGDDDCFVSGDRLHDLLASPSDEGAVEFEDTGKGVDLLLDGITLLEGVTAVKRTGHRLEVQTTPHTWTAFSMARYAKGWSTCLPVGATVHVEAK